MTQAISLNSKLLKIIISSIVFSLIYFLLVGDVFAQSTSPTPKQARRDAQKVKVCQVHEKTIEKRFSNLSELVKKMVSKFDAISTRVQMRYTERLVPAGKTINNYDDLLTDITAKKAAVDTALSSAQATSENFSCDASSDPKGQITTYREDMQSVKDALRDYRKSIRNLIVAVATASGEKLKSPEPATNE